MLHVCQDPLKHVESIVCHAAQQRSEGLYSHDCGRGSGRATFSRCSVIDHNPHQAADEKEDGPSSVEQVKPQSPRRRQPRLQNRTGTPSETMKHTRDGTLAPFLGCASTISTPTAPLQASPPSAAALAATMTPSPLFCSLIYAHGFASSRRRRTAKLIAILPGSPLFLW